MRTLAHFGQTYFYKQDLIESDPVIKAFFPSGPLQPEQIKEKFEKYITDFQTNKFGNFILSNNTNNAFVGRAGFGLLDSGEIEIGYLLLKQFWGHGLASEAVVRLLEWARLHINIDKIIAFAPLAHGASHRVMEKANMQYYKTDLAHNVPCKFYQFKLKA